MTSEEAYNEAEFIKNLNINEMIDMKKKYDLLIKSLVNFFQKIVFKANSLKNFET